LVSVSAPKIFGLVFSSLTRWTVAACRYYVLWPPSCSADYSFRSKAKEKFADIISSRSKRKVWPESDVVRHVRDMLHKRSEQSLTCFISKLATSVSRPPYQNACGASHLINHHATTTLSTALKRREIISCYCFF
jgi:hypothetical protein